MSRSSRNTTTGVMTKLHQDEKRKQFTVKRAEASDIKQLVPVAIQTYLDTYPDLFKSADSEAMIYLFGQNGEKYEKNLTKELQEKNNYSYFLMMDEEKIAGYAKLVFPLEKEKPAELSKLYFLKEYQGAGAGKALITYCFAEARKHDRSDIQLCVYHLNEKAKQFYASLGLKISSEKNPDILPTKAQEDFSDYTMQRSIQKISEADLAASKQKLKRTK